MAGPCTGLTVLDFSLGMPGAICTLVMADYGAEVIKVEPPGGDPFRFQPAWISWNRGKKGIVLDLGTAEGREQAIQLAGEADVLVESFRPGDMADWGLAYDTLSQLYPRLVYCSITGFGQKGPLRRVKGYEGVVAAKAGRMLNLQGQPTRDGPVYSAVYTGSWHASQAAVRGIIGALRVRDLCGRGQWVQTSILQNLAPPHDNNAGDGGLVNMQLRRRDPERFPERPGARGRWPLNGPGCVGPSGWRAGARFRPWSAPECILWRRGLCRRRVFRETAPGPCAGAACSPVHRHRRCCRGEGPGSG